MAPHPPIHLLSLCAGIGGIDLGLRLALPAARTICFVENEATAASKLVARMEDGSLHQAPVWSDLKTFDGRPWRGRVDILTAGYPCQPFSCAGKQRGTEDPRHLWPHVARVIREAEPEIVFLENVDAHLRIGYEQVRGELRSLGYEVTEGIFTAQEVGAPHLRKRLFVMAYRSKRGRGILRQSSRADGLTDRSHAELAHATRHELEGSHRQDGSRRRIREAGDPLDDTLRGQHRRPLEEVCAGRNATDTADEAVADAGDRCVQIARRRPEGRAGTRPAGPHVPATEGLADAERARLGRSPRQGLRTDGRTHPPARPGVSHEELADTAGRQREQLRRTEQTAAERIQRLDRFSGPLFPPGPADFDRWRELLNRDPSLKPSICRIAYGSTSRVDRLRAIGNGVVPLVAGYAFCSLARTALAAIEPEQALAA